jgi:hypothetical protein
MCQKPRKGCWVVPLSLLGFPTAKRKGEEDFLGSFEEAIGKVVPPRGSIRGGPPGNPVW